MRAGGQGRVQEVYCCRAGAETEGLGPEEQGEMKMGSLPTWFPGRSET